jgi:hypothetical protein
MKPKQISFRNDYSEAAHPRILEALARDSMTQEPGYGDDSASVRAGQRILEICERPEGQVHFVSGGTQANLIASAALLQPYESIIAAASGHICVHECGAIEATGHKVHELPHSQGKIHAAQIEALVQRRKIIETKEEIIQPQVIQPQIDQPQVIQPQIIQPQIDQPQMNEETKEELIQPQVIQPQVIEETKEEIIQPQMNEPQIIQPQMNEPQIIQPQIIQPQIIQPQMNEPIIGYNDKEINEPINQENVYQSEQNLKQNAGKKYKTRNQKNKTKFKTRRRTKY